MAVTPTIATNITATGTRSYNYLQALRDYLDANPNWTVQLATAIDGSKLTAPTVSAGGTGYSVGDLATLSSGTSNDAAVVRVTAESAGVVTAVEVAQTGQYSVNPTFPSATTGGNADLTVSGTMVAHSVGTQALVIRSPDTTREICFINRGSAATPDLDDIMMGINPDGVSDPIVAAETPWLTALNFSASSKALMREGWSTLDYSGWLSDEQFIWFEWSDCVCALVKTTLKTSYGWGFMAGKVMEPSLAHLESVGDIRIDGNGILGGRPAFLYTAAVSYWGARDVAQVGSTLRLGTGQTISTGMAAGWLDGVSLSIEGAGQALQITAIGPSSEYIPLGLAVSSKNGNTTVNDQGIIGILKYCHQARWDEAPAQKLVSNGQDVYLTVNYTTTPDANSSTFLIPIPDGFVVDP